MVELIDAERAQARSRLDEEFRELIRVGAESLEKTAPVHFGRLRSDD
ncbi:hypothetical protein SEA_PLATTE_104 [Microbacterium phage Platte]|nr:hypothetical protein SEA_HORTUS1_105 [Microbacterium phage Hortus1]AWY05675.1 hypothetical protein SEA_OLINDD_105 [Microbacterium phage OlinDD]AWY05928.1 hypothetical protein SEA_PIONEER3_105 [Microbacterium phage Pioneer3]AWY06434.1 hypothetical protein SEA_TANDEM_105 [Microbacterium phage Tandem]QCS26966.1 hypothetical protein SEA_ALLEB_119 [Microbacterium phage Alleb]QZD97696.1 hypothetical protein SEA_PLATTE_104 [Microbacterium phage Platte]